jgi:hypothetical protein
MARKLRLDLNELSVESFSVQRERGDGRGTVHGNSEYDSYQRCPPTEPGSDSYGEASCGWTCGFECDRTFDMCYTQLNCDSMNCPSNGGTGGGGGTRELTQNDDNMPGC